MLQTIYVEFHEGWDSPEAREELLFAVWTSSSIKAAVIDPLLRREGRIIGEVENPIDYNELFEILNDQTVIDVTTEYGDIGLSLEPIL